MSAVVTPERPVATTRPHLHAVDLVRVCTVAGVIAIHVVALTTQASDPYAGAVSTVLHANREVFFLLSALVLAYAYGHRESWSIGRFWARRYWLVVTPYVAWTVVYFLADHTPLSPVGSALHVFVHDLVTGAARYHLYFLLVTMQLYLVFPALLALLRAARRHLALLLAASALLQVAFTYSIHYGFAEGVFGAWARNPTALLPSYQLYIVAGAVAGLRLEEISAWVRTHRSAVWLLLGGSTVLVLGGYLFDHLALRMTPWKASEVFQPLTIVDSFAAALGLFAWGVAWADRPARRMGSTVVAASDASFGVYLAHPLVLQGALALVAGVLPVSGAGAGSQVATLLVDLVVVVPLIYLVTALLVIALRRTRFSVALTGRRREARAAGVATTGVPARSPAPDAPRPAPSRTPVAPDPGSLVPALAAVAIAPTLEG